MSDEMSTGLETDHMTPADSGSDGADSWTGSVDAMGADDPDVDGGYGSDAQASHAYGSDTDISDSFFDAGQEDSTEGSTFLSSESYYEAPHAEPGDVFPPVGEETEEDDLANQAFFEEIVDLIGDLPTEDPVGEHYYDQDDEEQAGEIGGSTQIGEVFGTAVEQDGWIAGSGAIIDEDLTPGMAGVVGYRGEDVDASLTTAVFEDGEVDASAVARVDGESWDLETRASQQEEWRAGGTLNYAEESLKGSLSVEAVESGPDNLEAQMGLDEGPGALDIWGEKTEGEPASAGIGGQYDGDVLDLDVWGEKTEGEPASAGVKADYDGDEVDASLQVDKQEGMDPGISVEFGASESPYAFEAGYESDGQGEERGYFGAKIEDDNTSFEVKGDTDGEADLRLESKWDF